MKGYKLLLALFFSAMVASSCNDWLQLEPYDGVTEDAYWRTKEDVHAVVIGCYTSLLNNDLMNKIIMWGEARADLMTPGPAANDDYMNIMRGEINPNNRNVIWDRFYTTINQCNKVIDKSILAKESDLTFTDALYRQYLAEAVTIRSLMYFYLVRSFRDVPLVLKSTDNDDQDFYIPKTEGSAILDSLAKHLDASMNHLPINYGNNAQNKGRITRWTAMALLADIYLWQGNYAGCRDLCNQIIGSGQFTLISVAREEVQVYDDLGNVVDYVYHVNTSDADKLFDQLYVTGNSVESIFEIQFPKTSEVLSDPFFDQFNSDVSRPKAMANTEVLDGTVFPYYEGNDGDVYDVRANGFSYMSGNRYIWKWTGTSRMGTTRRAIRNFPHWIVYRLPDVMLMKAEALNQLAMQNGNDSQMMEESYALVQQIRERSNAVETSETRLKVPLDPNNPDGGTSAINGKSLERLILNERAREFAFEGKRWYDILRFAARDEFANRAYLMELAINSTVPEKVESLQTKYNNSWFLYWPIYTSAIETNPNLIQNEFYSQSK